MTDDLVKRLRERYKDAKHGDTICLDAADRIEALGGLLAAAKLLMGFEHVEDRGSDSGGWQSNELAGAFDVLRAAIAKAEGQP